jgi:hypothetical protein
VGLGHRREPSRLLPRRRPGALHPARWARPGVPHADGRPRRGLAAPEPARPSARPDRARVDEGRRHALRARGRPCPDPGPRSLARDRHQPVRARRDAGGGEDRGRSRIRLRRRARGVGAGGHAPPARPRRLPARSRPRGEEHTAARLEPAGEPPVAAGDVSRRGAHGRRDALFRGEHAGAAPHRTPHLRRGGRSGAARSRPERHVLTEPPGRAGARGGVRLRVERALVAGLLAALGPRSICPAVRTRSRPGSRSASCSPST